MPFRIGLSMQKRIGTHRINLCKNASMSYTKSDVRRWMRDVMRRRGITQKKWASRAGVAQSTISRPLDERERFSLTKPDTLAKLAAAVQETVPFLRGPEPAYTHEIDPALYEKASRIAERALRRMPRDTPPEIADARRIEAVRSAYAVLQKRIAAGKPIDDAAEDMIEDVLWDFVLMYATQTPT